MTAILNYIPFFISFFIGYMLIKHFIEKEGKGDTFVIFFLAGGLGLGLSASLNFLGLVVLDSLNKAFIIILHLIILVPLVYLVFIKQKRTLPFQFKLIDRKNLLIFFSLIISLIPLWIYAKLFHPFGGWDAWSAWNFKAKFIFLGGENWKNLFDPVLWRSSPHYPLLLPLINVWGWFFLETPSSSVPFVTSMIFSFLTLGLLVFGLRVLTKKMSSIFVIFLIASLPFNTTLLTSQYCDVVFAYYLLASFFCLFYGQKHNNFGYIALSGIFLGFLSFTKSEGSLAALIIVFLTIPYFIWKDAPANVNNQKVLKYFLSAAFLAAIPTLLFATMYSPGNLTFINGLTSAESPSSLHRLKLIFAIFPMEFISSRWNGLWILLFVGLILSKGRLFKRDTRILPLFLSLYLFIVCFYYYLNTHFKIIWWMQVSLNRIVFALLPTIAFWVFYSLWRDEKRVR